LKRTQRDIRSLGGWDKGHDHGAGDPHAHDWDWSKKPPRQPGRSLTPEEKAQIQNAVKKATFWGTAAAVGAAIIQGAAQAAEALP